VSCEEKRGGKWASLAAEAPKAAEAQKQKVDRWGALGKDMSDDQQDITRGRGMVDSVFQGAQGLGGTHSAIMSSYDYISTAQKTLSNIAEGGYYIAPAFMDKLVIHITKNFLKLPNIKVPLILGVWGGKGQGKSFQAELVFSMLGINPIVMSAGELESGNAGEPAKLIRQRYREAADIIKKGKMCALFINDLDAGAGRMGGTTQYTVNNQMVNATLMNIADNPTNVQLPGVYNKDTIPRVPIIVTGNDFSTLYAPLIRDGRMEKFYWAPTRDDRVGVCVGIFKEDNIDVKAIETLVDTFPGQSIDFFGALRSRVYDDLVRDWVKNVGVENLQKELVNSKKGPPSFTKPKMTLDILLQYGNMLVEEQENVKRVQYAEEYLSGAALGNANIEDAGATADRVRGSAFVAKQPAPAAERPREPSFESSYAKQAAPVAEPPRESAFAKHAAPGAEKPKESSNNFAYSSRAEADRLADRAKESYFAGFAAQQNPPPLKEGCTDPNSKNYDPTARSDNGTCEYDFSDPDSFKDVPSFW
jgi:hypothetical protein